MRYITIPRYQRIRAPDSARVPEEKPVCTLFAHCKDCPYPSHGFICWSGNGHCMRETMKKLYNGVEENDV